MSTYTGFDMAPSALRWVVRDGAGGGGDVGGPIYGIRGCQRHPDYDSATSWSDPMAFRQGEFKEKFENGVEKTVRYELPEGHAADWLKSFFQSSEGHPAMDVNGTIAVAVPDHASPDERDDVLAGLSATKYANVSLIWRPVAILMSWLERRKADGFNLASLLGRRIFVLDLDGGRPELSLLSVVRHRQHPEWIVPSRQRPKCGAAEGNDEFTRDCYRVALGGVPEWEQLVGGQFFPELQKALDEGAYSLDAWVRRNGAWSQRRLGLATAVTEDILRHLRPLFKAFVNAQGTIALCKEDLFLVHGWVARRFKERFVSFFSMCGIAEVLPAEEVATGAALFAERLAKGLPTYYDRLPEYSFWDGFKTKWVQMFDSEQEVEPGQEYRYPEAGSEPRKLKIEKYADNVSFYVRELGSDEYARRIKTVFAEFLRSELELGLSAVASPEKGSARFELKMCDERSKAIFVSGKTAVREIVLRWSNSLNANKSVTVEFVSEHQGYVESQPVLGRIYDSEDNLRMVEEYVKTPRGAAFAGLWAAYSAKFHPDAKNGIADRVGCKATPTEPTRGLFGTRYVFNARADKATHAFALKCANEKPYVTPSLIAGAGTLLKDGMLQQNYCHCGALDDYKKLIRDLLTDGEEPQYNFSFYNAAGYVLGEDPKDVEILLNYICAKTHLQVERGKLWWSFFRMLCWHPECKLTSKIKPLLENALSILCREDANKVVNGGKRKSNDTKYLLLAILYALRIRESGEDLSGPLKKQLIALLSTGLLSGVSFPLTMVPKVNPASRPAGDTLSKYVLRFIKFEDTLADRELGAAMGGV